MKNNIYSNRIMSNSNELVRRLLSGITMSELQNLVKMREEATPYSCSKKKDSNSYTKEKCPTTDTVF